MYTSDEIGENLKRTWIGTLPVICLALLLAVFSLFGMARAAGFDLVTMKNGDIHHGTTALERFTIETEYGKVTVPYGLMESLHIGNGKQPDQLRTRLGDRFSGHILDQELIILRPLDPLLPLKITDISAIDFSHLQIPLPKVPPPNAVEIRNGDRFSAWVLTGDYLVKGSTSIRLVSDKEIHIMDIDSVLDESSNVAQIITNSGDQVQGQLLLSHARIKTSYGQTLEIPASQLSTIAFRVNHASAHPDFNFRRRLHPSSLIRDHLIDGTPGPEVIALRGGRFQRGDLQGSGDTDEQPPVWISLQPFAIGVYEVTFDEYDLFCTDTGCDKPEDEGWGRGRRPVINISWEEATAYTQWLSRKTRQRYRLPTDAEWEYAARAGTTTRFWWGQEPGVSNANCEGCGSIWDGEKSALTGRFHPNGFGLHDTAGNVFEWVADCFHDDFSIAPKDGSPIEKPGCGKRVIRSGAWSFPPKEIRSANRWRDFPTRSSDDTGFRIVRELVAGTL